MAEWHGDLLVIGGGINGSGIAADAQGRGLQTLLCERGDLGGETSSASSKLVHGGLRYLEQYEFKLVREALKEREVLLNKAPHLVRPLRFVLPHAPHLRPAWMIRAGLFLYDHLTRLKSLQKSSRLRLDKRREGEPLQKQYRTGFAYSDCRIDDARTVIANAQLARDKGAAIRVNTACTHAERQGDGWVATLTDQQGRHTTVYCRAIVNAAGPWVGEVLQEVFTKQASHHVRLVKGSHFVVPRLYEGDHAYILQNRDGRIVFALPYGFTGPHDNAFTAIGTTDVPYEGDPGQVSIADEEKDYLCNLINDYFNQAVTPAQILSSWSGVRPLFGEQGASASTLSREYTLELDNSAGQAPLLSVFGGKITTYRTLSEQAVDRLQAYFSHSGPCQTRSEPLPGGEAASLEAIMKQLHHHYPWLESALLYRYAATYGLCTEKFLGSASCAEDLGQHFGAGLYEAELDYLYQYEWATTLEAVIWRRTKLGLWLEEDACQQIARWLDNKAASAGE